MNENQRGTLVVTTMALIDQFKHASPPQHEKSNDGDLPPVFG
jgi:hypothetical protein